MYYLLLIFDLRKKSLLDENVTGAIYGRPFQSSCFSMETLQWPKNLFLTKSFAFVEGYARAKAVRNPQ